MRRCNDRNCERGYGHKGMHVSRAWDPQNLMEIIDEWTVWPSILGHNLATAGALCAAFWLGDAYSSRWYRVHGEPAWQPGCGRPAGKL